MGTTESTGREAGRRRRGLVVGIAAAAVAIVAAGVTTAVLVSGGSEESAAATTATPAPTATASPGIATATPAPAASDAGDPGISGVAAIVLGADDLELAASDGTAVQSFAYDDGPDPAIAALTELLGAPTVEEQPSPRKAAPFTSYTWGGLTLRIDHWEEPADLVYHSLFVVTARSASVEDASGASVAVRASDGVSVGDDFAPLAAAAPPGEGDYIAVDATGVVRGSDDPAFPYPNAYAVVSSRSGPEATTVEVISAPVNLDYARE